VIQMDAAFCDCRNLKNVDSLKDWKLSSLKTMTNTFCSCYELKSVKALVGWDL